MATSDTRKPRDLRCVWMQAGVVTYRLCDSGFDCEHCEFHRVMQRLMPGALETERVVEEAPDAVTIAVNQHLSTLLGDCAIRINRAHPTPQLWCQAADGDGVRLGLLPLLARILHPLDRIILPAIGNRYRRNQLIGWLVRGELTLPLHSPFNGVISRIHFDDSADLDTWNWDRDPLFEMRGPDLNQEALPRPGDLEDTLHHHGRIVGDLREALSEVLRAQQPPGIGITLPDGNTPEPNLERVLGTRGYRRLVRRLFEER